MQATVFQSDSNVKIEKHLWKCSQYMKIINTHGNFIIIINSLEDNCFEIRICDLNYHQPLSKLSPMPINFKKNFDISREYFACISNTISIYFYFLVNDFQKCDHFWFQHSKYFIYFISTQQMPLTPVFWIRPTTRIVLLGHYFLSRVHLFH